MRILIIEDEHDIARTLSELLSRTYVIETASTGADGIYKAEINAYNLIILDLGLPDLNGLEVCKRIRGAGITAPILILTAKISIEDKVSALDSYADDYLTKPFNIAELEARIRALLRRNPTSLTPHQLIIDDLILDTSSRRVTRAGIEIILGRKGFDLLEFLMRRHGQAVSRTNILEHVWDTETDSLTNFIDVNIKYLRDKIDRPFSHPLIKTVRGFGYRIEA
jgi:DNA-binding response OmpR family regulator